MTNQIERIVIVGGGTAGWLSAAYLNHALNNRENRYQIILIESSDIGTIGVGEATIRTIKATLQFLGIEEAEFMKACNASFKTAIKFVNWTSNTKRDFYWHPFDRLPVFQSGSGSIPLPISHHWLKRKLEGNSEPFDYSCYSSVPWCDCQRSPRIGNEPQYKGRTEYAYHLDAGLLATYLKNRSKARGVKQIVDNVVDVVLDKKGYISHLKTAQSGDLHGDLFIDCSGFRGLLINQALKEPFISYQDSLFCDSAIAMRLPREEEEKGLNPYTTSTALGSGWVWHVPLMGRSGNGYVYSSAFTSPEEAEREFRTHLGKKAEGITAKHLKMRVGRTQNSWVKNCVSIGLSGGFVEPLESTGIFFIEFGLNNLLLNFPDKSFAPALSRKYNQLLTKVYEEVRDFIVLHYCISDREDTAFWKANKYDVALSETLQEKLELWSQRLPIYEHGLGILFHDDSYACILAGLGYLPETSLQILSTYNSADVEKMFATVKNKANSMMFALPDHHKQLQKLYQPEPVMEKQ